jgi:hypothetical protein
MSTIDDMINELNTNNLDDVIHKQRLLNLKKQIEKRDALLSGLKVHICDHIMSLNYGEIFVTWKDPLNAYALRRYFM